MLSFVTIGALGFALCAVAAPPVGAAPARGCSGSAVSFTNKGAQLDQVAAPDTSTGTSSKPFKVAYDGRVKWTGKTDGVIRPGSWTVKVGPGISLSDSFKNDDAKSESTGDEKVDKRLPVKITGLFKVDVTVKGPGGSCTASGWILIADSPLFTPLWFGGIAFVIIGGVLFVLARPTRRGVM